MTSQPPLASLTALGKSVLVMSHITRAFVHGMYFFTQKVETDPELVIALNDEAELGNVMGTAHCLVQPLQGPSVPHPNTQATKLWLRTIVFANTAAPARELEPSVPANPPMVCHSYIMTCTCMHAMLPFPVLYTEIKDCALFHSWQNFSALLSASPIYHYDP